ncbi:hypothetical protein OEZ85_011844 [Tetradesmus obliquus]|uniref:Uncharacterized protein n=1 Tax=Tetradesmus obliquus TaxID=3088 RepID=A0ABY8TSB3_TETOB|nr:hypothetical protein OEZ85_011844 [Tetradesmus obliquus]
MAQLEDAFHAEYHSTHEPLSKALLRLLYCDLAASAWQHALEEEQRRDAAVRGFQEICRRRQEKGIPNSTAHKIRLNEEMLARVLPNATPRQAASRKFVPVSKVFTNPAAQAALAGLTTYYGQYTVPHRAAGSAETDSKHDAATAQLERQLGSSAVVRNMLRFGSGVGAGLAAAAGQLGLLDGQLAEAASRVWPAGSVHQLSARWLRVVSRVQPHVVLSLLHRWQCLPLGLRVAHASWQQLQAEHDGVSEQQWGQQLRSPLVVQHTAAQLTPRAEARQQSADQLAASEQLEVEPWFSSCAGDGRGGWQSLTAGGTDEEGSGLGSCSCCPACGEGSVRARWLL